VTAIADELSQSCRHPADAKLDSTAIFDEFCHVASDQFISLIWFGCGNLDQGTVILYEVIHKGNRNDHIPVRPRKVLIYFQDHQVCGVDHFAFHHHTHREGNQAFRVRRSTNTKDHVELTAVPNQLIDASSVQIVGGI